jgi:hypothetical protein
MASTEYHFVTHWRVEATREEVYRLLSNAPDLVRWWPSVYLDVKEIESGDTNGLGKIFSLHTRGWLPYTLRWQFRVTQVSYPESYALEAWGDFVGQGSWRFAQDGPCVDATYEWNVRADKPLLRYLSFLLKPIFAANHRWAMAQGEKSLRAELARRRSNNPEGK